MIVDFTVGHPSKAGNVLAEMGESLHGYTVTLIQDQLAIPEPSAEAVSLVVSGSVDDKT